MQPVLKQGGPSWFFRTGMTRFFFFLGQKSERAECLYVMENAFSKTDWPLVITTPWSTLAAMC